MPRAKATGPSSAAPRPAVSPDGTKMWAYDGKPLYTWAKNAKPGDVTGDMVTAGYLDSIGAMVASE